MTIISDFNDSINDAANLRILFVHCTSILSLPGDHSDLLRMAHVFCVSAFDKLIHDMIQFNMVETFSGRRSPTDKYRNESISMADFIALSPTTGGVGSAPPEILFSGVVRRKIGHLSFVDPSKLLDGLSLIWQEPHKWAAISSRVGIAENPLRTELSNIYSRRNAIVHEADRDFSTGAKLPIIPSDVIRVETFMLNLGSTIHNLV